MGWTSGAPIRKPYCKPKCLEFKLAVGSAFGSGEVRAECVECGVIHQVVLKGGRLEVQYRKERVDRV